MSKDKQVLFLTLIPSPYRVDFFNTLNKSVDLEVLFYMPDFKNLGWKNENKTQEYTHSTLFISSYFKGLIKLIKKLFHYRKRIIIIGGYAMLPEIIAILFLKIIGKKFILNSDGGFITGGFFKTTLKKYLISSAYFWLSSGKNTTKTLIYYGAKKSRIIEYPFSSITELEISDSEKLSKDKKRLRSKLNFPLSKLLFIYVGQLIHRKGVDVLIRSFSELNHSNSELLIIGEGHDEDSLVELVKNYGLDKIIHFLGKKSKKEVLDYLTLSDVFVLPSREDIWGLAVNEAIAKGLPVITTKMVGSSYNLISEGQNGYVVNIDNSNELIYAMTKISKKQNLELMQKKSIEISESYTIEKMVDAHLMVINSF